jgi:hypothetical protein
MSDLTFFRSAGSEGNDSDTYACSAAVPKFFACIVILTIPPVKAGSQIRKRRFGVAYVSNALNVKGSFKPLLEQEYHILF